MKTIGVIPARWGSTRFPGKSLAAIHGKPMIQWVIEGARTSRLLAEVIVATDDERIAAVCKALGCQAVMTDSELPSGTDRIEQATRNKAADLVVNIQGDEPLINHLWIDPLVNAFSADKSLQMATLAHPISEQDLHNVNAVKVVTNQLSNALYFSRFPIPHSRHSAKELGGHFGCGKHIGMYAYKKDFLRRFCATPESILEKAEGLEQLRALDLGATIKVIFVENPTLGVDTPEDLKKVEKWLEEST